MVAESGDLELPRCCGALGLWSPWPRSGGNRRFGLKEADPSQPVDRGEDLGSRVARTSGDEHGDVVAELPWGPRPVVQCGERVVERAGHRHLTA